MNHPAGPGLYPTSKLQIQGDPTTWGLESVGPVAPGWHDPVPIAIGAPVTGTLILSPSRVGSFALTPPEPGDGWMPAKTLLSGSRYLYIPTTTGLTASSDPPGYLLAAQYDDLTALQQQILDAMSGTGSTLVVNINVIGGGVVILDGTQLPFAVLSPAA